MKILITGATGFIGKELGKELVRRGHSLRVMSRDVHRARLHLPFPAEIISGRESLPAEALRGMDVVVNLAGEPLAAKRWTKKQKERIRDSRIKLTSDLMRLIRNSKVKTVISASAIGFYGDRRDEVLTEDSGPGSGFLAEVCRAWEAELFHGTSGMEDPPRTVALRFGVVLGQGGGALEKLLPIFRKGLGGAVGSGHQYMSWIHLHDLLQLIVFSIENQNVDGILNAVGPEPVTNAEFTRNLSRAVGRGAHLPVPSLALKTVLGEMASILLESQKVLPTRAQELGFQFQYPELSSALKQLTGSLAPGEEEFVTEQFLPLSPPEISQFFSHEPNLEAINLPKWRCKKWLHTHTFSPLGNGTLMQDRVIYQLLAGWLGQVSVGPVVAKDIVKIFEFRRDMVRQIIDQKYCQASEVRKKFSV